MLATEDWPRQTNLRLLLVLLVCTCAPPLAAQGIESTPEPSTPDEPRQDAPQESGEPVWLGVQIGEDSDADRGALIDRVVPESPAARAGLRRGDRIESIDGATIAGLSTLRRALADASPGSRISLTLQRDGERRELAVTLSAKPARRALLKQQLVGQRLPSFRLARLTDDGETEVAGGDLAGRPMVIEFWATWCPPCRQTAATLKALHAEYGNTIRIVPVSRQSSQRLRNHRGDAQLPYPLYRDLKQTAHRAFYVSSYPTLVVVGADGRIESVFLGAGHRSELGALLDRLVDDSDETPSDQ
jgi:thiol-disulfide isomerase/thioredoxin